MKTAEAEGAVSDAERSGESAKYRLSVRSLAARFSVRAGGENAPMPVPEIPTARAVRPPDG